MLAPQEASQNETHHNSTAHGQASFALPPIRNPGPFGPFLLRPRRHRVTNQSFQTLQVQSPGDIHVSMPSQPRCDSPHQWGPYTGHRDSNPTGQPAVGSVCEAPLAFECPYATNTNHPSCKSPSSPIATFHQQSSHREDSAANMTTFSSGMPTYSHATTSEAMSTTAAPFHPRSWTDQNWHSTAAIEISGSSHGDARIGITDRRGPSSPEHLSHIPSGQASIPLNDQLHDVAKLSISTSEVCFKHHSSEIAPPYAYTFPFKFQIINHCVDLAHFAKHYGEHVICWQQCQVMRSKLKAAQEPKSCRPPSNCSRWCRLQWPSLKRWTRCELRD